MFKSIISLLITFLLLIFSSMFTLEIECINARSEERFDLFVVFNIPFLISLLISFILVIMINKGKVKSILIFCLLILVFFEYSIYTDSYNKLNCIT